ncbi:hypothetical protein [Nostoc sp.]
MMDSSLMPSSGAAIAYFFLGLLSDRQSKAIALGAESVSILVLPKLISNSISKQQFYRLPQCL